MIPGDTDLVPKPESTTTTAVDDAKTATTSWSRLKDPRIVRVTKASGGKDRHSKVCTVRGLRDRRVRLSVPTAIQLYDLQERLGLNQPSKVVDWLLHAAKREIHELPPLQIPQGIMLNSDPTGQGGRFKDTASLETRNDEEERDEHYELESNNQGNSFPARPQNNESSFSSLMSSSNLFERWEPSSLSLSSRAPSSHGLTAPRQLEDLQGFNVVYQSGMIAPPYLFTPTTTNAAFDRRPIFNFNMAVPSHSNAGDEQSKRGHLHSNT